MPLSYKCNRKDPSAQGSEILYILPRIYTSLLFHEPKVATLSVIASKNSHLACQQNFQIFKITCHSSLTWCPMF